MTDYLQIFKSRFVNDEMFFAQEKIDNKYDTVFAYLKKFKMSWFATQLNTFIAISQIEGEITKDTLKDYSSKTYKYALKNHKGWPRGIQAGVGSISVLIGTSVSKESIDYCKKLSKKHWSAFEIPVIVDLSKMQVIRFDKRPVWGTIYFPYLKALIDSKIESVMNESK
ncbi:hypothetical protein L3049_16550 [Labilibaculum sp. DW002]|uniref:Uncharacterized protein n=1 Tax=Paralabilibaculum antarcticum TaxID=2912572 RepID=A0ABT5VW04_9BACT|nr:hypothetical protein [Labilibaculum sp. DW002]MDE5419603.1 hypothetical protein [Labilibaculum sp. DW002]